MGPIALYDSNTSGALDLLPFSVITLDSQMGHELCDFLKCVLFSLFHLNFLTFSKACCLPVSFISSRAPAAFFLHEILFSTISSCLPIYLTGLMPNSCHSPCSCFLTVIRMSLVFSPGCCNTITWASPVAAVPMLPECLYFIHGLCLLCKWFLTLGKPSWKKADYLWNASVRKGGGVGSDPIHNFEACFFLPKELKNYLFKIKSYGHFWTLFLKSSF